MQPDEIEMEGAARAQRDGAWLSDACGLVPETVAALLPFYLPLAAQIAARQRAQGAPLVVGIQGPQGAGKTTLTRLIERALHDVGGLSVATLSIDDLYLTRAQRRELAQHVHPLFQTRGVPGTHDVELGVSVLQALTRPGHVAIPRFDKGLDERAPESLAHALRALRRAALRGALDRCAAHPRAGARAAGQRARSAGGRERCLADARQ